MFVDCDRLEIIELGVQHVLEGSGSGAEGELEIKRGVTRHRRSQTHEPQKNTEAHARRTRIPDHGSRIPIPENINLSEDVLHALEERLLLAVGFFVQLLLRQSSAQLFKQMFLLF